MSADFDPPAGVPQDVMPGVRRVLADNPSPMTFRGTNTYLLGERTIAVIDPGPLDETHLQALLAAIGPSRKVSHIIVTHSHLDHSPLAGPLSQATDAPVLAFGGPEAGRSEIMKQLAANGMPGGGEGIDTAFSPDVRVGDGDVIESDEWRLKVLHTPGHIGNHICLSWEECCFVGDHVMGWASSLVSPPDGDLTDFMASCARLNARAWDMFLPAHGDVITKPNERLDWLIAHRTARETAILQALSDTPMTVPEITAHVYSDTPAQLLPAAERNVAAHLIDLYGKSKIASSSGLDLRSAFSVVPSP